MAQDMNLGFAADLMEKLFGLKADASPEAHGPMLGDEVALNPQPLPPHEGMARMDHVALNPQPLPPVDAMTTHLAAPHLADPAAMDAGLLLPAVQPMAHDAPMGIVEGEYCPGGDVPHPGDLTLPPGTPPEPWHPHHDVTFDNDQVIASGDGAVAAGGDIHGPVATGEGAVAVDGDNSGQIQTGDGIQVGGSVHDSTLVSGDVGGDLIAGNDGSVIGDHNSGIITGDDNDDAFLGNGNEGVVAGDDNNVGFGSGSVITNEGSGDLTIGDGNVSDTNVGPGAAVSTGGDATGHYEDNSTNGSYNTDNSINDSFDIEDSFNTTGSGNDDHSTNDSYNTEDSYNDSSVDVDTDVNTSVDAGLF